MKRKAVLAAVGFFFGAFVSFYLEFSEVIIFMLAVLLCLVLALFLPKHKRITCMFVALCTLLASAYSLTISVGRLAPLEALDGKTATVKGIVTDYTSKDSSSVTISGTVDGIPCKLIAYINNFNGEYGDEISFVGRISKLSDSPFFSQRSYYLPDGICLTASVTEDVEIKSGKQTLSSWLMVYSQNVSSTIRSYAGGDAGDVLSAMICGNSSYISDSTRLALNRTGIGHISAVSGLHVSVIAFALMLVLRKLRCPKVLTAIIAQSWVVAFVMFSGCRVSCIRAAIMMSVYILSTLVNRRGDALNTLSIAALIIMLANPFAAADVSFCLSLAGTFGVSVAAPYVTKLFGANRFLVKYFITCTCASVCTMPFVLLSFNEVSLIAPLANMVLVPVCSAAICLGMMFCVCGCAPMLSYIILVAGKLVEVVLTVCEKLSTIKITYLATGLTNVYAVIAIIIVLSAAAYIFKRSPKLVVLSVVTGVCVFVCSSAFEANASKSVKLDVLTSGVNCCAVLRENDECIIIDIDSGGKMADECENFIQYNGITCVDAVVIVENGEAAYSSYRSLSVTPRSMYLPKGSYIFSPDVDYYDLPDVITAYGLDISISDNLLIISQNGKSVAVSKDGYYNVGTVANICVLSGVTVVNTNEQYIYCEDAVISLELG